jgi:uncharacterized membrane protein YidH (DUF202 family)
MGDIQPNKSPQRRVHLANERTFLAWIRTSIAIMAFGFVVERFSLFLKEISTIAQKSQSPDSSISDTHGYASIFGIILVGLGILIGILAFFRYRNTQKQIEADMYRPSIKLDFLVTTLILVIGVFLLVYLALNI